MRTQAEIDRVWNPSCSDEDSPTETSIISYWNWLFCNFDDETMKADVAGVIVHLMLGAELSAMSLNELQILRLSNYGLPQRQDSDTLRDAFDA
jgi:hypothetical protein